MKSLNHQIDELIVAMLDALPGISRRIHDLAARLDGDDRLRVLGVDAARLLIAGSLSEAGTRIDDYLSRAQGIEARVQLVGQKAKVIQERGMPQLSRALTDRVLAEAAVASDGTRAVALFDNAGAYAYCGNRLAAIQRWRLVLELTDRPHYADHARVNLAIALREEGALSQAEEMLAAPVFRAPRSLRMFRHKALAGILAARGRFQAAVESQAMAVDLAERRGPVDRAQLVAELVKYLFLAGEFAKAADTAVSGRALVLSLEDERKSLAAAAMAELVMLGTEARLSLQEIDLCLSTLSREGQSNRSNGRLRRRPRRRR